MKYLNENKYRTLWRDNKKIEKGKMKKKIEHGKV